MPNGNVLWRNKVNVKGFKSEVLTRACSNFKETISENKQIVEHKVIKEEPGHVVMYFAFKVGPFTVRDAYMEMKFFTREGSGD
jgi:hypothetical protein